jgi:hypothetical protein
MKELQKTLFFAAYDAVVSSGNSITEKRQKELLAEAIIGEWQLRCDDTDRTNGYRH